MYPQITSKDLMEFIQPFYENKDIMHNMWHIELVKKQIDSILELGGFQVNYSNLILAMCFHGFIYSDEEKIRVWLTEHGVDQENVEKIIETAWESQKSEVPGTLEGKILHDAHVLEGGRTYLIVKTLITGSLRGADASGNTEFYERSCPGSEQMLSERDCPVL